MTEVEAMEFYNRAVNSESKTKQHTLELDSGAELTVDLVPVDRTILMNEIGRLPEEMLETMSEAEDEEEAQEMAEEENMLTGIDGDTIHAFQNICAESIEHEEWTTHNVQDIVREMSFEVLFEIGAQAIELSLEEQGSITGFREVPSDKNS